ncbi:hypothetical protein CKJ76_24145 [Mycobacterium avium]|uniref:Uncharacterized protein n=1 Tax=Mycobacterium intracellulare subsp. chimaera TaxID=222805 RepID=A0ABT7P3E3_MYCIT|nr:hypothetical protein [Mycobacterium intracellulare]MDM3927793.1 hypothetical protein [Mycobacterium intracellulare subsp. chimaera]PBA69121.1 hypothetical protein CKJ76_24145 [Mycobacterium avium]
MSPSASSANGDGAGGQGRRRKSRGERRSYTRRRAQRTANASRHGARWSIDDAKAALDLTRTVPELALQLGRTAAAVEGLRAKWRQGQLPQGLADYVPAPPKRTRDT